MRYPLRPVDSWRIGDSPDLGRTYILRVERPRFVVETVAGDDGSWQAGEIRAIEMMAAEDVDRLMSEAGDVFLRWVQVSIES